MTAQAATDLPAEAQRNTVVARLADARHALQELQDAWARAAAAGTDALASQALLTTIVLRHPTPVTWPDVYRSVAPVVAAHPARVLALVRDPDATRSPRPAEVGLVTTTGRHGRPVPRGEQRIEGGSGASDAALADETSAERLPGSGELGSQLSGGRVAARQQLWRGRRRRPPPPRTPQKAARP